MAVQRTALSQKLCFRPPSNPRHSPPAYPPLVRITSGRQPEASCRRGAGSNLAGVKCHADTARDARDASGPSNPVHTVRGAGSWGELPWSKFEAGRWITAQNTKSLRCSTPRRPMFQAIPTASVAVDGGVADAEPWVEYRRPVSGASGDHPPANLTASPPGAGAL